MAQEYKQKQKARAEEVAVEESVAAEPNAELTESTEDVLGNIDDLLEDLDEADMLAEMDEALEENAEEFVQDYVQLGGE